MKLNDLVLFTSAFDRMAQTNISQIEIKKMPCNSLVWADKTIICEDVCISFVRNSGMSFIEIRYGKEKSDFFVQKFSIDAIHAQILDSNNIIITPDDMKKAFDVKEKKWDMEEVIEL